MDVKEEVCMYYIWMCMGIYSICATLGIKNVAYTLLKGSVVDNSYGLCFLYEYITFMLLHYNCAKLRNWYS